MLSKSGAARKGVDYVRIVQSWCAALPQKRKGSWFVLVAWIKTGDATYFRQQPMIKFNRHDRIASIAEIRNLTSCFLFKMLLTHPTAASKLTLGVVICMLCVHKLYIPPPSPALLLPLELSCSCWWKATLTFQLNISWPNIGPAKNACTYSCAYLIFSSLIENKLAKLQSRQQNIVNYFSTSISPKCRKQT